MADDRFLQNTGDGQRAWVPPQILGGPPPPTQHPEEVTGGFLQWEPENTEEGDIIEPVQFITVGDQEGLVAEGMVIFDDQIFLGDVNFIPPGFNKENEENANTQPPDRQPQI